MLFVYKVKAILFSNNSNIFDVVIRQIELSIFVTDEGFMLLVQIFEQLRLWTLRVKNLNVELLIFVTLEYNLLLKNAFQAIQREITAGEASKHELSS